MQDDEADEHAGNDEDVEGEEARESQAADDGPAKQRVNEVAADPGNAAGDGCADAEAPVGVLVKAENLAGEGHAEGEQEQEDAENPGELARVFVGSEHEDLDHVDEHDGDHEVRAPAVNGAQEPAERDVVVEELEARPGLARGRRVDEREQDAGDDLQHEEHGGGGAEDVPPAGAAGRCGMGGGLGDGLLETETALKPVVDAGDALLEVAHASDLVGSFET